MSTTTAKVSVETKELMRALTIAGKCMSAKPSMPILSDVLLTKKDSGFVISATNMEQWIDIPLSMQLLEGELVQICVNYAMLRNAVIVLPQDGQLLLEFTDKRLSVDYTKGKFSVSTESADEFPIPINLEESENITCKLKVTDWLLSNIRAAKICAAQDNLRPQLASVCVDVTKTNINVVSTDQQTMYYNSVQLNEGELIAGDFETNVQIMLSIPSVDALCSSFSGEELTLVANSTHVSVLSSTTGVRFVSRLQEGNYVPYQQIIALQNDKELKVELSDILGALKRCCVFANELSHLATLTNDGSTVSIAVENINYAADCGEAVKKLDGSTLDGDFKIAFNILRLSSLLTTVSDENLLIKLSAPERPMLFKEAKEGSNLILLLMPMKI